MILEFGQGIAMTAGLLWLLSVAVDKIGEMCYRHKRHKARRAAQKKRMAAYGTGDRRPAPLTIAQEYAAEQMDVTRAIYAGAARIDEMRKIK